MTPARFNPNGTLSLTHLPTLANIRGYTPFPLHAHTQTCIYVPTTPSLELPLVRVAGRDVGKGCARFRVRRERSLARDGHKRPVMDIPVGPMGRSIQSFLYFECCVPSLSRCFFSLVMFAYGEFMWSFSSTFYCQVRGSCVPVGESGQTCPILPALS